MDLLLWNILQVSLTTSIVIVPVLIFCAVLRRRYPARIICLLWVVLSARLLIPVQITFPDAPIIAPKTTITMGAYKEQVDIRQQAVSNEQAIKEQEHSVSPSMKEKSLQTIPKGANEQMQKKIDFRLLFAGLWLVGAIIGLGISLSTYFHFWKRIRKTAYAVKGQELLMLYTQEKEHLGIHRKIPILQSCEVDSPMIAGFLQPVLLLPEREIAMSDMRLILRHELTHYKHGDLYGKLLFMLAKCVHWFNPVIHMLAWQGAQDLEIACDQDVIQGLDTEGRRQYGQCILNHTAGRLGHHPYMFTTQLTGGKRAMKIRLQELFTPPRKRRGVTFLIVILLTGSIVGCSFAIRATDKPNAETVQQMNLLAQQWCDAQKGQLTPIQVQELVTGNLKEQFDKMLSGYVGDELHTPLAFDNLPMETQADEVTYTLDPDANTAEIRVHTKDTPYGGMTQLQTIRFAREGDVLRIAERTIEEAMLLDQPEEICTTAQDILARGMPENPVDASTPMALVYLNFPVAGGRYHLQGLDKNLMIYSFADGTMIYFAFERLENDSYHLKGLIEPQNNEPSQSDTQWIAANQIANQWASGYLHKNAAFSYPVMSKKMQQEFIRRQEAEYGLSWFWRIGWGSSPSVKFWNVEVESNNRVLIVYQLYAGGEEFRYTERLHLVTENEALVADTCEVVADGMNDDVLSRQEFVMLYAASEAIEMLPPQIDEALIQEWKKNEKERYEELMTPEGALKTSIGLLNREAYTISRASGEISVYTGTDMDLAIGFPDSNSPVFVTMHGEKTEEGDTLWQIGRFWSGKPNHTI